MVLLSRREFLRAGLGGLLLAKPQRAPLIQTISGPITPRQLGTTLVHEHFLVDFIGADQINPSRWQPAAVAELVLPYLQAAQKAGVKTICDCTPAFLGRDISLLQQLSRQSGLQLITNTGYYGARENKFLPSWALTETAEQLAQRWIKEFTHGIDNTTVRPGFIKIGVDATTPLSSVHQKLVRAAALAHRATGLTIFSHTGPGEPAWAQLEILREAGVQPAALVWVHAQAEKDLSKHVTIAQMGAWVSLDGMGWGNLPDYVTALLNLKKTGLLPRVLISHDAGWYKPQEPQTNFKGYTAIFTQLLPLLRQQGFTRQDIHQLLVINPAAALGLRARLL